MLIASCLEFLTNLLIIHELLLKKKQDYILLDKALKYIILIIQQFHQLDSVKDSSCDRFKNVWAKSLAFKKKTAWPNKNLLHKIL